MAGRLCCFSMFHSHKRTSSRDQQRGSVFQKNQISEHVLFIRRITPTRLTIDSVDYLPAKWVPLAASDIGRGPPLPAPRPMREVEEFGCTFLPMTVTIADKLIT